MKISIFTATPGIFSKSFLKEKIKSVLGKTSGPKSVEKSLLRGLDMLGIDYNLNPSEKDTATTALVINGTDSLKYAIGLKNRGLVKKILAGPAIVISPDDSNSLLLSDRIDKVLVPSSWVRDYYLSVSPELKNRIEIWASGVEDSKEISTKDGNIIIYQKSAPLELLQLIESSLTQKNIKYSLLKYGQFDQREYFSLLRKSPGLIYLSRSESQGLALQEAWIRDVPTIIWNRGVWQHGTRIWYDKNISAPYLSPKSGMFFADQEDFEKKIDLFLKTEFNPRDYCVNNLTDELSAKKLVEIINSMQ